jgi:hypothetical protein
VFALQRASDAMISPLAHQQASYKSQRSRLALDVGDALMAHDRLEAPKTGAFWELSAVSAIRRQTLRKLNTALSKNVAKPANSDTITRAAI